MYILLSPKQNGFVDQNKLFLYSTKKYVWACQEKSIIYREGFSIK